MMRESYTCVGAKNWSYLSNPQTIVWTLLLLSKHMAFSERDSMDQFGEMSIKLKAPPKVGAEIISYIRNEHTWFLPLLSSSKKQKIRNVWRPYASRTPLPIHVSPRHQKLHPTGSHSTSTQKLFRALTNLVKGLMLTLIDGYENRNFFLAFYTFCGSHCPLVFSFLFFSFC